MPIKSAGPDTQGPVTPQSISLADLRANSLQLQQNTLAVAQMARALKVLAGSLSNTNSFLKEQTSLQRQILETKTNQKEVYRELLELLRAIKQKQEMPVLRKLV